MASELKNLSSYTPAEVPNGAEYRIGIVVSEYHSEITFALRDGAVETLLQNGVLRENIVVDYVPGAFELPLGAQLVFTGMECDAVIALGCVVKGDTEHDVYINTAVANELMMLGTEYEAPFVFGLLTTNTMQQAKDRSGGKLGNKGTECAVAALKMLALIERCEVDEDDNSYLN
ncbi:MAG: 6,7-dimethyl-8-ribityllumazine synthase [Chitinophagales bacterium]